MSFFRIIKHLAFGLIAQLPLGSSLGLRKLLVSKKAGYSTRVDNVSKKVRKQSTGNCYAHASASVIIATMKRKQNQRLAIPDHDELRNRMRERFGDKGADTAAVLAYYCPKFGLTYSEFTDVERATEAVRAGRPLVYAFSFTDAEFEAFRDYFEENPTGEFCTRHAEEARGSGFVHSLGLTKPYCFFNPTLNSCRGHAVVITGETRNGGWRFKNSWGINRGDNGEYRVSKRVFNGMERFFDLRNA